MKVSSDPRRDDEAPGGLEPGSELERELDRNRDSDPELARAGARNRAGYRTRRPQVGDAPRLNRVIVAAAALVVALAGTAIAASMLPLWWAHRVSAVADGTSTVAVPAGLTCGTVGTLLALLVWRRMLRRGVRRRVRGVLLLIGLLFALPDLMTLGIVVGSDVNAVEARRVVDAGAPGFRGASLLGALAGVVLAVALTALLAGRRRNRRRIRALEAQLEQRASDGIGDAQPADAGGSAEPGEARHRAEPGDTRG